MADKPYLFGVVKRKPKKADITTPYIEQEEPGLQGILGSSLEERTYNMLLKLGWKPWQIEIQTPILGGRQTRGGMVVDFVLFKPSSCAISCKGGYWHENGNEEIVEDAAQMQYFNEYVVIWDYEVPDDKQLEAVMRNRIGAA